MPVAHGLVWLCLQCAPVWQGLDSHALVGRGIDGVHFVAGDRFALGWLTGHQQLTQLLKIELAIEQHTIHTAERAAKQWRFAEGDR